MVNEAETIGGLVEGILPDVVEGIVGASIPEPIKQNFFKAFGQLCTAAVEIPVAYLEGVAAERRAETQARVKLIEKSSNEIAAQMQFDPSYARAAVHKFGQRVIRERLNLDKITRQAASALIASPDQAGAPAEPDLPTISDDWLNVFEKEAEQKSTEDMQALFAKVLAGEIRRPSTYSIKTVRILGQLDQNAAELFRRLCSMCIALRVSGHAIDARVPSLGKSAVSNGLAEYGLSFASLNLLHEYGLIIADYNSWMSYRFSFGSPSQPVQIPFEFGNTQWGLVEMDGYSDKDFRVHGVALTQSGTELLGIVDIEKNTQFAAALAAWFESRKAIMTPLSTRPNASSSGTRNGGEE